MTYSYGKIKKLFKGLSYEVWLDCAVHPWAHGNLGAWRLRTQLQVRIAQRLADRVNSNERTRGQEVLALDVARALRVHLRPLRVGI